MLHVRTMVGLFTASVLLLGAASGCYTRFEGPPAAEPVRTGGREGDSTRVAEAPPPDTGDGRQPPPGLGGDPRGPAAGGDRGVPAPGPLTHPSPRDLVWYPPPRGLHVSIWVSPRTFALGDPVTLEVVVENTRSRVYEQRFPTGCRIGFEVVTERGVPVAPYVACTQALSTLHLDPGERRVVRREWTRGEQTFDAYEVLRPGRYWVTAGLYEGGRIRPMVEPVMIDVLPR